VSEILILAAHPDLQHSRVHRALLAALRGRERAAPVRCIPTT
jgi:hypothetical protein